MPRALLSVSDKTGIVDLARGLAARGFELVSTGGVWAQPALGRAADVWGYAPSYVVGAGISILAVPPLLLSRRQNMQADWVSAPNGDSEPVPAEARRARPAAESEAR